MISQRHLNDAALAEIWTASSASGESATDVHLLGCAACAARYDGLCAWLEGVRAEALDEAEAAFPADRLAAQQAHILRRLEAAERPARVIAFPKFAQPLSHRPSIAHRWITVAAAAGLVIGVALGQWMDLRHRFGPQPTRTADAVVASVPAPKTSEMVIQTAATLSDDALLLEVDALTTYPSVAPLRALDTITPRSRDFVDRSR
jgi:hypothetical protein